MTSSNRTIWLNVTTSVHWNRPPVGIVRVEQEYCRWLLANRSHLPEDVRLCLYDKARKIFVDVAVDVMARKLNGEPHETQELLSGEQVIFHQHDCFVSLGIGWSYIEHQEVLQNLRKEHALRTTFICYDIVPILFPQYAVITADLFGGYTVESARTADVMLCISENTRRDWKGYLEKIGVPPPSSHVVTLGADISAAQQRPQQLGTDERPFVLFVSTIERRKNHEVLYRAWSRLRDEGFEPHRLVFVGMPGWGVADLLKDMELDPRVRSDITILNHVSDSELSWLYENSAFTAYPSLYEGWGLPVVESLAHGKFCLSSNAASLPEAGGDLIDYIDPWDLPRWVERLRHYMQNPDEVVRRNAEIKARFRAPTWEETGKAMYEVTTGRVDAPTAA